MKSSAKWPVALFTSFLALGGIGAADPSATPGATPPRFNVPIPLGHDAKGITLPYFDKLGKLQMDFSIGTASRVDNDHLEMKFVHVNTYDEKGTLDLMVDLFTCVLDLNTRVVTSESPAKIQRSDFEIIGRTMTFDTQAKTGKMKGKVRMLIYNRSEVAPGGAAK